MNFFYITKTNTHEYYYYAEGYNQASRTCVIDGHKIDDMDTSSIGVEWISGAKRVKTYWIMSQHSSQIRSLLDSICNVDRICNEIIDKQKIISLDVLNRRINPLMITPFCLVVNCIGCGCDIYIEECNTTRIPVNELNRLGMLEF